MSLGLRARGRPSANLPGGRAALSDPTTPVGSAGPALPPGGLPVEGPKPHLGHRHQDREPLPPRGGLQPWDVVTGPGDRGGQMPKTPVRSETVSADSSLPTPRRIPEQKPGAPCWPGALRARPVLCAATGGSGNYHHNQGSGRSQGEKALLLRLGSAPPAGVGLAAWRPRGPGPGPGPGSLLGLRLRLVTAPLALQGIGDFAV